jgi:hypothetical protein
MNYDQTMLQLHLMNDHGADDDQARRLARAGGYCPVCSAALASALGALRQTR